MKVTKRLLPLVVVAGLSACNGWSSGPQASQIIAARDRLAADIHQCSETYHYDPRRVVGVPENALARNEMSWRLCAYEAIRIYEYANPTMAPLYNSLIDQDILMTTGIQNGTITRSERTARIRMLLDEIKAAEARQIATSQDQQTRQLMQINDMIQMFQTTSVLQPQLLR